MTEKRTRKPEEKNGPEAAVQSAQRDRSGRSDPIGRSGALTASLSAQAEAAPEQAAGPGGRAAAPGGLAAAPPPGPAGAWLRDVRAMAAVALMETAGVFPAVLLYAVRAMHGSPPILLLLIGLVHLGGQLAGARQVRGGRAAAPALALAVIAAALDIAAYGLGPAAAFGGAALLAAALRGLLLGRQRRWTGLLPQVPAAGVFAAALLYAYIAASKPADVTPYAPLLYGLGMAALFLLLLRWNRYRVRAAALDGQGEAAPPGRIEGVNRRLTWLLLLVIVAATGWQGLGPLLLRLGRWLIGLFPAPDEPLPKDEPPAAIPDAIPGLGNKEDVTSGPPEWLRIAGNVLVVLVLAVAAFALLALLYRLVRRWLPERARLWAGKLGRLLRGLRLVRRAPAGEGDYIEEVERIEPAEDGKRRRRLRLGASARSSVDADPRVAYRRFMRAAIKRGFGYRPSHTPSENRAAILSSERRYTDLGADEIERLVDRYNEERYGK